MKLALRNPSLQIKITAVMVALVLFLAVVIALVVRAKISTALGEQLDMRGVAIAENFSAQSVHHILINDAFGLQEMIDKVLESTEEVRYVLMLDVEGNVIAHSFDAGLPKGLAILNTGPIAEEENNIVLLDTEEGRIRDIAVPILESKAGVVRIGLSENRLREAIGDVTRDIALATAIVVVIAIIGAYFLAALLTRPIFTLVNVMAAVGKGDLGRKAPVVSGDEIGRLTSSFNAMIDELAMSRQKMERDMRERERMAQELQARNRELSTLNAIVAAASQSLDLDQCLGVTLARVLELMELEAGWVNVFNEAGGTILRVHQGLSPELAEKAKELANEENLTRDKLSESVMVGEVEQALSTFGGETELEEPLILARVLLSSKGEVLGTLNLLSRGRRQFTPQNRDLLAAIGQQVGSAIENAKLYSQVQNMAILEERDRIGREMHDGLAQVLGYLNFQAGLLERSLLSGAWARAQEEVREMRKVADEAYSDVREAILGLRTSISLGRGLIRTVAEYLDRFSRQTNIKVQLVAPQEETFHFTPTAEVQIIRIIQEALTNVRKHAPNSEAWVRFETNGVKARITVEDNGPGFDPVAVTRREGQHFGLQTMRERAREIGGDFILEADPNRGTKVTVIVPVERRDNDVRDKNTPGR